MSRLDNTYQINRKSLVGVSRLVFNVVTDNINERQLLPVFDTDGDVAVITALTEVRINMFVIPWDGYYDE